MLRRLFLIALLVLFVCSAALADPILLAPRGTTLKTAQIRAEAALSPSNDEGSWYWLGTGFAQFEANIIRFKPRTGKSEDMINVQWNFLPETLLTPALTFGVVDAADESDEGTGIFVAATRHFPIGKVSKIIKMYR